MRRLERLGDQNESLLAALDVHQASVWTALPGILESVDLAKLTCSVRPAVKALHVKEDGSYDYRSMPLLLDCPIIFPSGGGFVLTFPLVPGDEALVIFSSRCIDSWWQSGGEQAPFEYRMHDLSDGFVLPGPKSRPRALTNVSSQNVQLRSDSGTAFVEIAPTGDVKVKSPVKVVIEAPQVDINGSVAVVGAALTHNGVNVGATHRHIEVRAGGDVSGVPQ